jgi:hypothetical protein
MVRYLTMIGRTVRPEVSKDERGRRGLFAVKMHSLDNLFYVIIKLNDLNCEIPPGPPLRKGGRPLWLAFPSASPFCKGGWRGIFMLGGDNISVS